MNIQQVMGQAMVSTVYAWIRMILATSDDPGKALDAFRNILKKAVADHDAAKGGHQDAFEEEDNSYEDPES